MKRLLIATDNFLPRWDGISRFLSEILPTLSEKYDITILAPEYGEPAKDAKYKIVRFPMFKFQVGDFPPARPVLRRVMDYVKRTDVVFAQSIGPVSGSTIYYATKMDKPCVSYIHSLEWDLVAKSISVKNPIKKPARGITKMLARILYNRCDLLLVPSLEVAEILNWQKIRTKKRIVHMGTDTGKFVPPKSKKEAKERIGIDPSKTVIGYCGRLAREKNLITLHRAFLRLQKRRKDVTLLIVGDGIPEVRNLFKNKKNIRFVGLQDNPIPFYQAMDIYVLPSLTETSSLSTMEAMSCGVAAISTPVGYIKDYVIEGFNGMFFPREQAYLLSKKLEKLVDDPELTKRLGENARKTIVAEYSWEKTIEDICKALEGMMRYA